jgi:hypothetical protein
MFGLLLAAVAVADEAADKRAASLPAGLQPLRHETGLSTGLSLPMERLPKAWSKKLRPLQQPGRALLMPGELPTHALIVTGPTWYSVKWREGDRHVVLMVRYAGFVLPGFKASIDAASIVIGRSHGLVSGDTNFEGAAVTIDVECAEPKTDPACASDDHLRRRIMGLAVLR